MEWSRSVFNAQSAVTGIYQGEKKTRFFRGELSTRCLHWQFAHGVYFPIRIASLLTSCVFWCVLTEEQVERCCCFLCNRVYCVCYGLWPFNLSFLSFFFFDWVGVLWPQLVLKLVRWARRVSYIVQELCESRGGRPGLSVLTSLLVSVDVKLYWTMLRHWSQLVPDMSTDIWGHQASLYLPTRRVLFPPVSLQ